MARFFKKLYTQQKETVDDDFPELGKDKVGDNLGLKLISNFKSESFTFKATGFKHPNGKQVEGTLEPEVKLSKALTLKGKFITTNKFEETLSIDGDKVLKGSTFFLTGKGDLSDSTDPKHSFEVGFDYLNKEFGSLNLKFISPVSLDSKNFELYSAFVGYYQGVSLGGDVQLYPARGGEVSKANGYLQYDNSKGKDFSTALFGKYESKGENVTTKVGVGHYHEINKSLQVAGEVSLDPKKPNEITLKVAETYKLDDQSKIKPRFSYTTENKELRFGLVFKQTVSPIIKVTLSTEISVNPLVQTDIKSSNFKNNQFGVTLSFFD